MLQRTPFAVYLDNSGDGRPLPSLPFDKLSLGETFTVVMDSRVQRQSPTYKVAYTKVSAGGQNHKRRTGSIFTMESDVYELTNQRKRMMPHEVIVVTRIK